MTTAAIADRAVEIIGSVDPSQFQAAFDVMSTETETANRETISSPEIFAVILNNIDEWKALSAEDREIVQDVLTIHAVNGVPTKAGAPARTVLINTLGNNTKIELAEHIPIEVPKWPGLTPGNVSDALNGRANGDF